MASWMRRLWTRVVASEALTRELYAYVQQRFGRPLRLRLVKGRAVFSVKKGT